MKQNITLLPLILCIAVVGCNKSEKIKEREKEALAIAPIAVMQIKYDQEQAFKEALDVMSKQKEDLTNSFVDRKTCYTVEKQLSDKKYVDKLIVKTDCSMITSFKKNPFTPDLNGKTLLFKMENEQGIPHWSCYFNGKTDQLPNGCKQ